MSMRTVLDGLRARIDARTRRERLLLAGAGLAILLLLWEFAVRAPLYGQWSRASARVEAVRGETRELRSSAQALAQQIDTAAGDSGEPAQARLRERIAAVDEALTQRTLRIISPAQMVAVLRDVVSADDALTLAALRNTGVEPVIEEARPAGDGDEPADVPRVYRHRVELVIEGGYFDLLAYLERLEGLRWQFQWDGLEVETVDYPRARATVTLSTLSLAEDWIGV